MHILIAPNAFKNSLDAGAVALALEEGFLQSSLDCTCTCFPVADGGDGTGSLIVEQLAGETVAVAVRDPLGRGISATYGLIESGRTAVIEMANASGLRLLPVAELNPLRALSFGTGEQMRAALDRGVSRIVIGMGGSATVDGGVGILRALGCRFLDSSGVEIDDLPEGLGRLAHVDVSMLDRRILDCEVVVLCDVDNYLLGASGAAAIFGPQKGASPSAVGILDSGLARFAAVTLRQTGRDIATVTYGGTAGGAAAGLYGFLGARLVNGIDYFLELTGFAGALSSADVVVTGEGSIDEQTLQGKGPFGVAKKAKEAGVPVVGIAGKLPLIGSAALRQYFDVLLAIGNAPAELAVAMRDTRENVIRVAQEIGSLLRVGGLQGKDL